MNSKDHAGNTANRQKVNGKGHSPAPLYGENFAQILLNNLEVAVYTCDADGFISMYNPAAAKLWGREPRIGTDLWCGSWKIFELDAITPIPLDECPMALTLKEGRPINGREIIILKPNGERHYVIPYPRPLFSDEGRVTGAINLLVDVTPYKRNEQREAHTAAIVRYSDDAIISKTLDGTITSWNAAAEKIFGYSAVEMIGQSVMKLIPPDRWAEELTIQEQLRSGNRIDHYETKRLTWDGRLLDVSLTISPIYDSQGAIIGASKIARNITRQKQDELALRESEERYRLAVETAKLGTWSINPHSGEMNCSSECRTIFGIQVDILTTGDFFFQIVHPEDLERVREEFDKVSDPANRVNYNIEHRIVRVQDNDTRWIRVKGKMYFNAEDRPEKLIGTILDITDEKMTNQLLKRTVEERTLELQKMNEQLRQSNHDLEQFAYIASHDLQEPLRKIQSFIDIIRQEDDKATAALYFSKITKSAKRMSTLIKDVLNYSRLGKSETLFTDVDLNHILKEVKTDYEALITEKQAVITAASLPVIKGIESQLRQLFANLVSNALKFSTTSPAISITARPLPAERIKDYRELDAGKEYVELTVADNGIGFDQHYADKIFMIFQRLHSRAEYSGTGIGLALCKKIVENHHGHIGATSQPGHGAVFTVILPRSR